MTSNALIIDGYVDEPACLGVAPYISPYIREVAGVLSRHGYSPGYVTIDQVRADPALVAGHRRGDVVIMIAGLTVPGAYIGGKPATLTEVRQLGTLLRGPKTAIGGPIAFGYAPGGGRKAVRQAIAGFDATLSGSPAVALDAWLSGGEPVGAADYSLTDPWSVAGAGIIARHPAFPYVMCELETAIGCSRATVGGCSFCTEPFYGLPRYRSIEGIAEEVAALRAAGARHFRLGRQPDLLAYQSSGGEFPVPRPDVLGELFSAVRENAPDLATLHIDNINPGTIARHEDAARAALAEIVAGHTPGDTAAFGMETADPAVVAANNLKAMPDDVFRAIEVVNDIGAKRTGGIPELLPGLNFIVGLAGETPASFDANEAFLRRVLDAGLLVRRVNIRQVMPFEGTAAYEENTLGAHDARFRAFKEWARTQFDEPMLRRVFPAGTVLRDVIIEIPGKPSFGRQMGSYPILVGIPLELRVGTVLDAVVVDWGMRSVTALPCPVEVNTLPVAALRWLPGVGKKRAATIAARRPFRSLEEFREIAGETGIEGVMKF
ncbi:radical SAM protein [Methanoculleus sp.]|uniref:radical SAM protein n=1 Tax=Methanoculleus sp. TaxID=90427 RepID=UPI0032117CFC